MAIHLLIVDDEQITRDGLCEMVPWNKYGIDRISAVSNGKRALELIMKDPPDILLTDIRMPKMDGIELATRVRQLLPDCLIVLISAYSDKEYLKSAISLKAEQYIEKPINIAQVEEVACKLSNEILSRRLIKESEDALLHGLIATEPLVGQKIALELISPDTNLEKLFQKYGQLYFPWREKGWYTPVCIKPMFPEREMKRKLLTQVEQYLNQKQSVANYYAAFHNDGSIVLLFHRPRRQELENTLLPELLHALWNDREQPFSIGVGAECSELKQLPDSWMQACSAADGYFYADGPRIISTAVQGPELSKEKAESLLSQTMQGKDQMRAAEQLCDILGNNQFANVLQVKELLYRVYWQMFHYSGADSMPITLESFFCMTLEQIREIFRQGSVEEKILQGMQIEDPRVLRIVRSVLQHFSEQDFSIRIIADEVGLSQNYLCTLFRQQTGSTLNDFILQVRLETAKKLLCSTQLRLYEISNRIGIADPNYLSYIFKRDTGVTPSSYRANQLKRHGRNHQTER